MGAFGSWLGSTLLGLPTSNQSKANSGAFGVAGNTAQQGSSLLGQGDQNMAAPASYFSSILSGNMGQPTSAFAPEVNRIRQATQAGLQAETNLAPRGGARSSALFALPSNEESNIQGIYNQARPAAATALAGLGAQQAGLGNQASSIAGNTYNGLAGHLQTQANSERESMMNLLTGLAKGLGA